jgi:hypothetical protein
MEEDCGRSSASLDSQPLSKAQLLGKLRPTLLHSFGVAILPRPSLGPGQLLAKNTDKVPLIF